LRNVFVHEWKGLALLVGFAAIAALFIATLISPPWNDAVLQTVAEQPQTVRPPHPANVARN
jgi:hypothetical protein